MKFTVVLKDGREFPFDTEANGYRDFAEVLKEHDVGLDDIERTIHYIEAGRIDRAAATPRKP